MTELMVAVAIVVLGWFAIGTTWNVHRGRTLMRWMEGGLPRLGARTTMRWLGSTAVELVIREAKAPFQDVTVVVFLEPRDIPWMWALSRWRGRRDTLIIRGQLRAAPKVDLDALDRESWSGRDALRALRAEPWSVREPAGPGELPVYYKTPAALLVADALTTLARGSGLSVRRLALRRARPHLQVHLAPPRPGLSAGDFFQAVRALGERAPA